MTEDFEVEDIDAFSSNEDYHKDTTRISKSGLDLIEKSPLHYYAKYQDPNRIKQADTPALIRGKISHSFTFEPHLISKEYAVVPEGLNLRTNAGKDELKAFQRENIGKTIISKEDFELGNSIKNAVHKHPVASMLLKEGAHEEVILWEDPDHGVKCKSRLDKNSNTAAGNFIVDLKTCQDASKAGFGRSAFKYRYDVQGAFYPDAYHYKYGEYPQGFIFIAVETKPPFAVAIYHMTKELMIIGRNKYRKNIETYKDCNESGIFPGYSPKIEPLIFPGYAMK